jgi:pyruvate-formate lyase
MRTLLNDDCVATGVSYPKGGSRYNNAEINLDGIANVADSLAAIKRLVFEDGVLTMKELIDAVRDDFQDREGLRQRLLNRAPKFGNDDNYVDEIAARAHKHAMEILAEQPSIRGGHCVGTPTVGMTGPSQVNAVGSASPDGRRRADPVVDSIGPSQGRDRNGPTAMLNSVSKLDMSGAVCGATLNIKFHPSMLASEKGPGLLYSLLEGYFNKGGINAQLHVVDDAVLKAAQQEPEKYKDLVVRVAGYNANFVDLPRNIQNDIIARTAQTG